MPNIFSINAGNIVEKRKIRSKLTFNVGEKFSGKIIKTNPNNKSVTVKLIDGWQFEAEVSEQFDNIDVNKFTKFTVEGYENGKLKIKISNNDAEHTDVDESSLKKVMNKFNLPKDEKNVKLLKMMIKFKIPLTRENIAKIKGMVEFQEKILNDENYEKQFINKFIQSKGLSLNSQKGNDISRVLKNFFSQFKKVDLQLLMTLEDNNIDLNEQNLKSFVKLQNGDMNVYKSLDNLKQILSENQKIDGELLQYKSIDSIIDHKEISHAQEDKNQVINENNLRLNNDMKMAVSKYNSNSEVNEVENMIDDILNTINNDLDKEDINLLNKLKDFVTNENDFIDKESGLINKESSEGVNKDKNIEEQSEANEKNVVDEKNEKSREVRKNTKLNSNEKNINSENKTDSKNNEKISHKEIEINNKVNNTVLKQSIRNNNTAQIIKDDIINKIAEMKNTVEVLLKDKLNLKPQVYEKIMETLNNNINDFKVFNSISDQYYYLDTPINYNQHEYPCKLIIKDDRKSGKRIDKNNVKIAASVKTINIGVIDIYITIKNANMKIEIKSDKKWIGILEKGKAKLQSELDKNKYSVIMKFEKREKEMNIVNCADFFEEQNILGIDRKV